MSHRVNEQYMTRNPRRRAPFQEYVGAGYEIHDGIRGVDMRFTIYLIALAAFLPFLASPAIAGRCTHRLSGRSRDRTPSLDPLHHQFRHSIGMDRLGCGAFVDGLAIGHAIDRAGTGCHDGVHAGLLQAFEQPQRPDDIVLIVFFAVGPPTPEPRGTKFRCPNDRLSKVTGKNPAAASALQVCAPI